VVVPAGALLSRIHGDGELESILLNRFGRNLRIKPNFVTFKLAIRPFVYAWFFKEPQNTIIVHYSM
jgi:hypothetical protein